MAFSTRRGRPKTPQPKTDRGTPELRRQRACGHTIEPIDLYARKGLITDAEHRAALHLRWLHSLTFGTGAPTSSFPLPDTACSPRTDDPAWRTAREKEYHRLVETLVAQGTYRAIRACCMEHQHLTLEELQWMKIGLKWMSDTLG